MVTASIFVMVPTLPSKTHYHLHILLPFLSISFENDISYSHTIISLQIGVWPYLPHFLPFFLNMSYRWLGIRMMINIQHLSFLCFVKIEVQMKIFQFHEPQSEIHNFIIQKMKKKIATSVDCGPTQLKKLGLLASTKEVPSHWALAHFKTLEGHLKSNILVGSLVRLRHWKPTLHYQP